MVFDKDLLAKNIYKLLDERGLKVGDLEKVCGLSTGYISRLKSTDRVPNIEAVMMIAEYLNVTLDFLVYKDLTLLNAKDRFILGFLEALSIETQKRILKWEAHSPEKLDRDLIYEMKPFFSPLYIVNDNRIVYASQFEKNSFFHLNGVQLTTKIDGGRVFLVSYFLDEGDALSAIDLYFDSSPNNRGIIDCPTTNPDALASTNNGVFVTTLVELYKEATDSMLFIDLPRATQDAMQRFMSRNKQ